MQCTAPYPQKCTCLQFFTISLISFSKTVFLYNALLSARAHARYCQWSASRCFRDAAICLHFKFEPLQYSCKICHTLNDFKFEGISTQTLLDFVYTVRLMWRLASLTVEPHWQCFKIEISSLKQIYFQKD